MRPRGIVLLVAVLAVLATPARAQVWDPDRCWSCRDTWQHAAAGATLDLVVRSGLIARTWRDSPLERVALVALVGAAYEGVETLAAWENGQLGEPGYGFGLKDLAADVAGAVTVEVAAAVWRALRKAL